MKEQVRKLAVSLLNEDNGISEDSFIALVPVLEATDNKDLLDIIDATDGRWYLKSNCNN